SGDRRAMAVAHLNLSTVLSRMNRLGEAMEESRRALRYSCSVNALTTQARALGNLGWLMIRTDRSDMAVNFFREAHRRSYLAEDHSMLAACRTGEGRALLELGRMSEARECLKEATELGEAYGMDHETREDYEAFRASIEGTGDGQGS
nr:tetratricopeptide repeat protein [Candidatus Sabulitectum sp.]